MTGYRSEIDGIRAIAVLSVILFHAGFTLFPGGFVGVDVFFVISGYLITSLIIKESERTSFSFKNFYERRIRRLIPPLIPVLLFTLFFSFCLLGDDAYRDFVKSSYSALGFVSNWHFLSTVGYFGGPGELTPLLHIWSLSVEEQFYFIFPVIIVMGMKKGRGQLLMTATVILGLSFLLAEYLVYTGNKESAFFNSFARFWELLVGAVLAIRAPSPPRKKLLTDGIELIGFTMIMAAIFLYTKATPFPGFSAMLPVIGTAMMIASRGQGRIITPLLKTRIMVSIGLISYALYLWHWPVMVLVRTLVAEPPVFLTALGILFSAIMATASYFFIEKPIRSKALLTSRSGVYWFAAIFLIIGATTVGVSNKLIFKDLRLQALTTVRSMLYGPEREIIAARIEGETTYYQKHLNSNFTGKSSDEILAYEGNLTCSFDYDNAVNRIEDCLATRSKSHNVLVMGDSIGRDGMHALKRAYPAVNFIMLHQSSCPPADNVASGCFRQLAHLLNISSGHVAFDTIIINFRYRPKTWVDVEPTLELAKQHAKNVLMFGVSPVFAQTNTAYIQSLDYRKEVPTFVDGSDYKATQWDYWKLARDAESMAAKHGVTFINILDFFCPEKQCRLWVGNKIGDPLMIDQQHLTDAGVSEYADYLKSVPQLSKVLAIH